MCQLFLAAGLLSACGGTPHLVEVTRIIQVTQVVPVTQIVPVTRVVSPEQFMSVTAQETPTPADPTSTATVQPSPTAGPNSVQVSVSAALDWQESGLYLAKGDQVSVKYISGTWTFNERGGQLYYVGPDGYDRPYLTSLQGKCWPLALAGAPYGALIARIDFGPAFLVGSRNIFTASQSGHLYFKINDDCNGDDQGQIVMEIDRGN